jgi:hypothetical protein
LFEPPSLELRDPVMMPAERLQPGYEEALRLVNAHAVPAMERSAPLIPMFFAGTDVRPMAHGPGLVRVFPPELVDESMPVNSA